MSRSIARPLLLYNFYRMAPIRYTKIFGTSLRTHKVVYKRLLAVIFELLVRYANTQANLQLVAIMSTHLYEHFPTTLYCAMCTTKQTTDTTSVLLTWSTTVYNCLSVTTT